MWGLVTVQSYHTTLTPSYILQLHTLLRTKRNILLVPASVFLAPRSSNSKHTGSKSASPSPPEAHRATRFVAEDPGVNYAQGAFWFHASSDIV